MADEALIQLLSNQPPLYEPGNSVMWTDPHIARELLRLHLDPEHDIASRSAPKIDRTAEWILRQAGKQGMEVLDLGCGPGLYAERMARQGHAVTGVDFSEHSLRYAGDRARQLGLVIDYRQGNYLELDVENRFDLAVLIYLDFGVLLPAERDRVLGNIVRSLKPGGMFVCDVVNERNIHRKVLGRSWEATDRGFWRDAPYLALAAGYHYPEARVLLNRHVVLGSDGSLRTYHFWNHYYAPGELMPLMQKAGFAQIRAHEHVLPADGDAWSGENITFYTAVKP